MVPDDVTAKYQRLFDHLRARAAEDPNCFARERFWSLGDSVEWPVVINGLNLMYIRDAYGVLFQGVLDMVAELRSDTTTPRGIAILGNPGTGKSCFLVYCLVMFLFPPQQANYGRKSVFLWYTRLQHGFRYDAETGSVTIHQNFLVPGLIDGSTICLFDGARSNLGQLQIPHTVKLGVAALSPSHLNDDQWNTDTAYPRYLGPWGLDELIKVGGSLGIKEDTVKRRHLYFGGIARSVLAVDDAKVRSAWERIKGKIADPDEVSLQSAGNTNSDAALTMTHSVFAMIPSNDLESIARVDFVSPKIHNLYVRTLRSRVGSSLSTFLAEYHANDKVASVWGQIFEDLAHEHLIRGDVVSVEWFKDSRATTVAEFNPKRFAHSFYFDRLDEICQFAQTHPSADLYCIPYDKTFTGLDAIARSAGQWFGFQMTKNERHPVIVARINDLRDLLLEQKLVYDADFPFPVYWVVPEYVFPQYPLQKLKTADGSDFVKRPSINVHPCGKIGMQCVPFLQETEWQLLGDPGSPLDEPTDTDDLLYALSS